jgi:hypothetical protein
MNKEIATIHMHLNLHDWKYFNTDIVFYRYCEFCDILHIETTNDNWINSSYHDGIDT